MSIKDPMGNRFKRYELASQGYLTRRMPVIIRLDGVAFHTFTKQFERPFSEVFAHLMNLTTKALVERIQGCKLGYVESDEISLLLIDYNEITTEAWFDYNVQKICSVSASIASTVFNGVMAGSIIGRRHELALFDSRAYNVPREDVCNYFLWRQRDSIRNSINALGQSKLGHKACHGLNQSQLKEKMLQLDTPVSWDNLPIRFRLGGCFFRDTNGKVEEDRNPPIFSQDRNYIEKHVFVG